MEKNVGRIWLSAVILVIVIVIWYQGHNLKPLALNNENPLLTALTQLGVLYIIALFVERAIEVLIKAWRQGGKVSLEEKHKSEPTDPQNENELIRYKVGTQRRALLVALTLGILISLAGVRLLGPIFGVDNTDQTWGIQQGIFQFTDILITAGLIAGGSTTIHELMALIDDFLKTTRNRANNQNS